MEGSQRRVLTKRGALEEGMANHSSACHENPMSSMKKQKDMAVENESPRTEGVQYATEEDRRAITNSFRKNEATGPKWKQWSVVDMTGSESKVQCCKE